MAEIKTSVTINSTQEKIWDIISDIDQALQIADKK